MISGKNHTIIFSNKYPMKIANSTGNFVSNLIPSSMKLAWEPISIIIGCRFAFNMS